MSIEDIFRAAQKAHSTPDKSPMSNNSEQWKDDYYMSLAETEPPVFSSSNTSPEEQDKSKWYEKTWLIAIMILLVFPVGLILLWSVGRYSKNVKVTVTVLVAFLIFLGQIGDNSADKPLHGTYQSGSYDEGYLKSGASWKDINGKSHYNSKKIKVEIWKQRIVVADGGEIIQIYFLEGENAGVWGYVSRDALSK